MLEKANSFIVLEGADGSGKGTQFKLLAARLKAVGYDVETFDFPRYDQPSSYFVRRYLNGDYGPASAISPYSASLFYALDRFEAAPAIRKALDEGKVVLSNRYVGSSMAHQGSKFTNEGEQRGFFIWIDSLEYQLLGIPRPSLNLFLRVPTELSFQLIDQKAKRSYTDKKHDEHEADIEHLRASAAAYDNLCRLFPKDFQAIECAPQGELLDIPTINDMIWQAIQPILPPKPPQPTNNTVFQLSELLPKHTPVTEPELKKVSQPKAKKPSTRADFSYFTPKVDTKLAGSFKQTMKNLMAVRRRLESYSDLDEKTIKTFLAATLPLAAISEPQGKLNLPLASVVNEEMSESSEKLELLESHPRNEFSLLNYASKLQQGNGLNYEEKYQALKKLLADKLDGHIAEQISYRWRAITNQKVLLELIEANIISDLHIKVTAPNAGYEMPEDIEDSVLEDDFKECYQLSQRLFNDFKSAKRADLGLYATLAGHKAVFEFSSRPDSLRLRPAEPSDELRIFLNSIVSKIAENQPLVAGYIEAVTKKSAKSRRRHRTS